MLRRSRVPLNKATAAQVRFEQFNKQVKERVNVVDVDGQTETYGNGNDGSGSARRGRVDRGYHMGFIVEKGSELYKEMVNMQYKKTRNQSFLFWFCSVGCIVALYVYYVTQRISTKLLKDPYDHSIGDFNVPVPQHLRKADDDAESNESSADSGAAAQPVASAPWVGLAKKQKSAIDELRDSHDTYLRERQQKMNR